MEHSSLIPWTWGRLSHRREEEAPLPVFRSELELLHRDMDRLFDELWHSNGGGAPALSAWTSAGLSPRLDETEDDKAYHVAVELPGLTEKDVEVTLSDGQLCIRGEKKREQEQKGEDYYRKERVFGAFRRQLPIPGAIDESKIKATFKNGVLTVDLPKSAKAKKKVKQIEVRTT